MSTKKYVVLGLSVVFVMLLFLSFSNSDQMDSEYTGIVSDIKKTTSGFVFNLNMSNDSIKCFSFIQPKELGYYGVSGSFSESGDMFFVNDLISLD